MNENSKAADEFGASIVRRGGMDEGSEIHGRYLVQCFSADGSLKWEDVIENLVTTQGRNDMLDKYLSGASYTASWFMGLVSSVSYSALAAADTMASHAGWTEAGAANAPTYSQSTRPAVSSWAAASAGAKATSATIAFSITGSGTVKGAFLTTNSTKDGTTGTLFSVGLFSGGDRVVANTDTLNVTSYTATLT
jgi:hypothetical protein